ncbi:hypothetical protein JHK82_056204 [Glycine max]|nr:hypothetical protein JHK82_056204 [Glycine max]
MVNCVKYYEFSSTYIWLLLHSKQFSKLLPTILVAGFFGQLKDERIIISPKKKNLPSNQDVACKTPITNNYLWFFHVLKRWYSL